VKNFMELDALLSEEEKALRGQIRDLVRREVLPRIAEAFEQGRFPAEVVPELARMGLLGMKLPEHGGRGASSVEYGLACQELERGDSGLRSFLSVTSSLVMYPIHRFGTEAQRSRWLPALARGEKVGCFGLTEPEAGSDPGSMKTRAIREGGTWVLSGMKRWISFGGIADLALVWARTDEGIGCFLVEKGTPGFSARPIPGMMSLRASVTSSLLLQEVRVPESNRLPGARGLKSALACLNEARLGIAWGAMGAALACFERALEYSKKRIQFGRPIASFQLTQRKLVKMYAEICKGQLLALQISRLRDRDQAPAEMVNLAKMNNVSEALKIARCARSILGGNGVSLEFDVMRHLCNLESLYTYEGTHEVHTLALGRALTGISAFGERDERRKA